MTTATAQTPQQMPTPSIVEQRYEAISRQIDKALKGVTRDFEKLQTMVYNIIMMNARLSARSDQEQIFESLAKQQKVVVKVKDTYATWLGSSITIISAVVSMAGGAASVAVFLPTKIIAAESARALANAGQSIASAGTGLSGIGTVFNNREEGKRTVYQNEQQTLQSKLDERKAAKQSRNEERKGAKASLEELNRKINDARKTVLGG